MLMRTLTAVLVALSSLVCASPTQDRSTAKANEIIEQSVTLLGGRHSFNSVNNLVFSTNSKDYRTIEKTYFADDSGNFKMTIGFGPYLERAVTYFDGEITDNNHLAEGALSEYEKAELTCFAKLISGVFSLQRFRDDLSYVATRKYGFKEYHLLRTSMFEHEVTFSVETDTGLLGRMVIAGQDEAGDSYESMFDFKDPINGSGITLPGTWVHNFLGGSREAEEVENRIEGFKTNERLDTDFWTDTALNFGSVIADEDSVAGNVIETWVHHRLGILMMSTNIRWKDIDKLDLEQHEDLVVSIERSEYPGLYFPDRTINPPREKYAAGKIFVGDIAGPYVGFFMWGDEFKDTYENKTPPLAKVVIRRQ